MNKLLKKEYCLSASLLTYLFLAFGAMTLIPGYPILMGAFFVSFGIFQSFQSSREAGDIHYSALLPVAKRDIAKAKYLFSISIEMIGFLLMAGLTILRMTALKDAIAYVTNVMMSANPVFLAFVLLIFAEFNGIFLRGFFRTAYYYGKPFVLFIIATLLTVGVGETLHHIPGLGFVNSSAQKDLSLQMGILLGGIVVYVVVTVLSCVRSMKNMEQIDL